MHKKIKHIIAVSLVIGTVSGVLPANNFILGSTVAYAATTYKGASNGELSSLTLTRGSGSEIEVRDSYSGNETALTGKGDYYIELDGSEGLDVAAEVQGSGYVVKTFTSSDKTEQGKDPGEYIKIDSTYSDVYLRTYKSEQAYEDAYSNGDVTYCEKTYIIHVKKPVVVSDAQLFAENAYLRSIYLSDANIDFSKDVTSYNVNVNENAQELLVRATPEGDDYSVSINDYDVNKDNNYEQTIKLDKGNTAITIKVESNDSKMTYTLNVYRGNAPASTTTGTSTSTNSGAQTFTIQSDENKLNSWQTVDGKWKYIDGTGEVLKNQWWFDKSTGINYYLKEDGYRATGWFSNNNNWYYFNENGEMKTDWINVNKNWYYLNKSGVMEMGWLEDSAGNWYYLDGSGTMKTGWITNSDGKWYYLDATGKMIKNSTIGDYNVDSNGVLIN